MDGTRRNPIEIRMENHRLKETICEDSWMGPTRVAGGGGRAGSRTAKRNPLKLLKYCSLIIRNYLARYLQRYSILASYRSWMDLASAPVCPAIPWIDRPMTFDHLWSVRS